MISVTKISLLEEDCTECFVKSCFYKTVETMTIFINGYQFSEERWAFLVNYLLALVILDWSGWSFPDPSCPWAFLCVCVCVCCSEQHLYPDDICQVIGDSSNHPVLVLLFWKSPVLSCTLSSTPFDSIHVSYLIWGLSGPEWSEVIKISERNWFLGT